jgi:hypothetical protein
MGGVAQGGEEGMKVAQVVEEGETGGMRGEVAVAEEVEVGAEEGGQRDLGGVRLVPSWGGGWVWVGMTLLVLAFFPL